MSEKFRPSGKTRTSVPLTINVREDPTLFGLMCGVELAGSAPRRALWHPARLCLRHPRQGFLPFRSSDDAASDRNGIETITLRGRISTDQFQVTRNIHWFFHTRLPTCRECFYYLSALALRGRSRDQRELKW